MAKIAIAGTGYVGLISGACLADFGHSVICVDKNTEKINLLKKGKTPIFEPGLEDIIERTEKSGRLKFTSNLKTAIQESEVIFIAVGTPTTEDGNADLQAVESVAREIAKHINSYKVIVDKSTVPIGTARKVQSWIKDELKKQNRSQDFAIVSNPEFLREGSAIQDFTHPDRVVIGAESKQALSIMKEVYRALYINETPYIETDLETAETIKYAANAFLAVKISYINEIANLCEKVGANVQTVAKAMGRDPRIGAKFLHAGPGFGGSCLPKDTMALVNIAKKLGAPVKMVETAIDTNEKQKEKMLEKITRALDYKAKGKTICFLGLAFKPNTDDIRKSPAIKIIPELIQEGAQINACDPQAIANTKIELKDYEKQIKYFDDEYEAMKNADCIVLITEWNRYRTLDIKKVNKILRKTIFCDLRNVYSREVMENAGFTYIGVGT